MVYMASIALARSGLFITYTRTIATTVIVVCGACSEILLIPQIHQGEALGTLHTWLEILGTAAGGWKWVLVDPVCGLSQGKPSERCAVWYCLVDEVALRRGPYLMFVTG